MSEHIYGNPNKYSQNNSLQYNFAMAVLSKISFVNKSRVLDIGCGDGVITNEIAEMVGKGCVIGTDISEQMIEFATQKYKAQNNLRFLTMDASKNIFYEQFDVITSFNCLHWVKDQLNALQGIANAAVYDAQIVLLFSHRKSLYHVILDKICSSKKWSNYFTNFISPRLYFNPNEYQEMLVKVGLEILELSEEEMTYLFKSKAQLKDFFNAAGAQIKHIPLDKREEFLNDFIIEYFNEGNIQDDNSIPVSFWCLQVVATKPNPIKDSGLDIGHGFRSKL